MKKILILAVVVTAAAFSSCENYRDGIGLDPPPFEEATAAPTEATEAVFVDFSEIEFEGFDGYSDYHDYFSHTDISESDDYSDEIISDTVEEQTETPTEKITENPTESEKTEKNEPAATTEKPSKEKKPDYKTAGCIKVPYKSQEDYPTGCELVSTSMLLSYYGLEIEPMQLIEEGYIKSVPVERKGGKLYGGDPNKVFVGDPTKTTGYGCYSSVVTKCLKKILEDEFFDVYSLEGMTLKDICSQYIDFDQPVIIWASIDMKPLEENEESMWIIEETGEEFRWLSNEHCMVLVGYDEEYYYIHDPQKKAYAPYKRSDVEKRFKEMGSQAVTIIQW